MPSFGDLKGSLEQTLELIGEDQVVRGNNNVAASFQNVRSKITQVSEVMEKANTRIAAVGSVMGFLGVSPGSMQVGDGPQTDFGRTTGRNVVTPLATLGGAVGGAKIGALIGSVVPGVGTAIGTAVGSVLGAFLPQVLGDTINDFIGTQVMGEMTDEQEKLLDDIATGTMININNVAKTLREDVQKKLDRFLERQNKLGDAFDPEITSTASFNKKVDEKVEQRATSLWNRISRNLPIAMQVNQALSMNDRAKRGDALGTLQAASLPFITDQQARELIRENVAAELSPALAAAQRRHNQSLYELRLQAKASTGW